MAKPDIPTNCREHANGRVKKIERHYVNGKVGSEYATFLCGCTAHLYGGPGGWSLDETIFWKEGQA